MMFVACSLVKHTVNYLIKSKFYVVSEFFSQNKNCSKGHIIIIRFHFDDVPSMFFSKLTVTYKIKSKFYVLSDFFHKIRIAQGVP